MLIQALIGILMLIIVISLSVAFLPVIGAGLAALGSLLVGTVSRAADVFSGTRAGRKPKTPAVGSGTASGK